MVIVACTISVARSTMWALSSCLGWFWDRYTATCWNIRACCCSSSGARSSAACHELTLFDHTACCHLTCLSARCVLVLNATCMSVSTMDMLWSDSLSWKAYVRALYLQASSVMCTSRAAPFVCVIGGLDYCQVISLDIGSIHWEVLRL